jgi:NTP-dependent ternary system trypsin peptidase co-occuring protein
MVSMSDYVRFPLSGGGDVVVEVHDDDPGVGRVSRSGDAVAEAGITYEAALEQVRRAADATVKTLRRMDVAPDGLEVQFGVRLNGEVGAVIAKAGAEANFTVKITWSASSTA